jgi:integrase
VKLENENAGDNGAGDEVARQILRAMHPSTSAAYHKCVRAYTEYRGGREDSEEIVVQWLASLKADYKASSLWSMFSLVKKFLRVERRLDLGSAPSVRDFLKCTGANEPVRHAAAFNRDQIMTYLKDSAQTDANLVTKLVLGLGFLGGLRVSELVNLVVRRCHRVWIRTRQLRPSKRRRTAKGTSGKG